MQARTSRGSHSKLTRHAIVLSMQASNGAFCRVSISNVTEVNMPTDITPPPKSDDECFRAWDMRNHLTKALC